MNKLLPVQNQGRLIQLDVLRGIAILLVIGRHYVISPAKSGWFLPIAGVWARFGWTGVDLFFVLSGFLVGGLLFKELHTYHCVDIRRFIIRRILKIWPLYYLYLIYLVLEYKIENPHTSLVNAFVAWLPCFLHIQNYFELPRTHLWSLAVEEHFYLVLPIVLLILTWHKSSRTSVMSRFPYLASGILIACLVVRCLVNSNQPFKFGTHVFNTAIRVDSLFFGVLIAYFYYFKPDFLSSVARHRFLLITIGLILISPMMIYKLEVTPFVYTIGFSMLYLGYGCILVACIYTPVGCGRLGRFFGSKFAHAIAFIGYSSYPIYLWHQDLGRFPTILWLHQGLFSSLSPSLRWLASVLIYAILAVASGVVIGLLIEKPTLALRNRLFPARVNSSNHKTISREAVITPVDEQGNLGAVQTLSIGS